MRRNAYLLALILVTTLSVFRVGEHFAWPGWVSLIAAVVASYWSVMLHHIASLLEEKHKNKI